VTRAPFGPTLPDRQSYTALRPASGGRIDAGLWHERRAINREVSIPDGWEQLNDSGNLHNLRLAAGTATGDYRNELPFTDSDVSTWLEAVGWLLAGADVDPPERDQLEKLVDEAVSLLADAQADDGYLNSYVQVRCPGERWQHLGWGHELYSAGHLIQAGITHARGSGRTDLLQIGQRLADCIDGSFGEGPGRVHGVGGHPEIESALVELFRLTGERRYLERAAWFVEQRGHGLLGPADRCGFALGRQYWQDHLPVRHADTAEGHVVRQLNLLTGAVDVATETKDEELLTAVERVWTEMVATKMYVTGGMGVHHFDETFGCPYELPPEGAYTETCAAIASVMLSWRLLLARGKACYADVIERTLYNGVLPGVSLTGDTYLHANPLKVGDRTAPEAGGEGSPARISWFRRACCPPNLMRLFASLEHYVLAAAHRTIAVTQYLSGTFEASTSRGEVRLAVDSGLPWEGSVRITLEQTPDHPQGPWALMLRDPAWSARSEVRVRTRSVDRLPGERDPQTGEIPLAEGDKHVGVERRDGWIRLHRRWRAGDVVELKLDMGVRLIRADPRVDAVRGAVAIERGPLVYCLEGVDHPGLSLDDVVLDPSQPLSPFSLPGQLDGMLLLRASGWERSRQPTGWWPYEEVRGKHDVRISDRRRIELLAVPYYAWGNRAPGPMRVWVPMS
jgi:DUF1680 family protein